VRGLDWLSPMKWTVLGIGAVLVVLAWKLPSRFTALRSRAWYNGVLVLEAVAGTVFLMYVAGGFRWWYAAMGCVLALGNGLATGICPQCGLVTGVPTGDSVVQCSDCGAESTPLWKLPSHRSSILPRESRVTTAGRSDADQQALGKGSGAEGKPNTTN